MKTNYQKPNINTNDALAEIIHLYIKNTSRDLNPTVVFHVFHLHESKILLALFVEFFGLQRLCMDEDMWLGK